jgi:hypothetical protein
MAKDGGAQDPENPGSWDKYSYVQGDPINFIDPQGLLRIEPHPEFEPAPDPTPPPAYPAPGPAPSPPPPTKGSGPITCPPGYVNGAYGGCVPSQQQQYQQCVGTVQAAQQQTLNNIGAAAGAVKTFDDLLGLVVDGSFAIGAGGGVAIVAAGAGLATGAALAVGAAAGVAFYVGAQYFIPTEAVINLAVDVFVSATTAVVNQQAAAQVNQCATQYPNR